MDEVKTKNFILINNLSGGGAERQVSYISQLVEIDKLFLLEQIISYEIPKEKTILISNYSAGNLYLNKIKTFFRALKILKENGLDRNTNLICFLQLSYIIGFLSKYLFGCKLTICIRTNPFGFYEQYKGLKIPFFIYKKILMSADHIICNSKTTADELNEKFKFSKANHISNGYDIDILKHKALQPIHKFDQIFNSNRVLITAGRLLHDKGQWHMIRVFAKLLQQHKKIKLVFLGEGPLLDQLINLCKSFDLKVFNSNNDLLVNNSFDVYFLGFQKNPYAFISKSYLFIMPSLYEGLPNAPIESLIVGTPCILSDCKSGPREILLPESDLNATAIAIEDSKYGYLLPPFDGKEIFDTRELNSQEQYWLETINHILNNEQTYVNLKKNTCIINELYNISRVNIEWLKFLKSR